MTSKLNENTLGSLGLHTVAKLTWSYMDPTLGILLSFCSVCTRQKPSPHFTLGKTRFFEHLLWAKQCWKYKGGSGSVPNLMDAVGMGSWTVLSLHTLSLGTKSSCSGCLLGEFYFCPIHLLNIYLHINMSPNLLKSRQMGVYSLNYIEEF